MIRVKHSHRIFLVALLVLIMIFASFIPRHAKAISPRLVVLTKRLVNGEQLVTFRTEPQNLEVTFVDLVSASYDTGAPVALVGRLGFTVPAKTDNSTNPAIKFVALPVRGASFAGKSVVYTPGSYTVAYTPDGRAFPLRAGIANRSTQWEDVARRLRNCLQDKSLEALSARTFPDATFVATEILTNLVSSFGNGSEKL